MAYRSDFFTAKETSPGVYDRTYTAERFANRFKIFFTDGVFANAGNELAVSVVNGTMKTQIATGVAFIQGYAVEVYTDPVQLTHDAADATNDRIDRVVLRLDRSDSVRDIIPAVVKGTPAVSPSAPALTRNGTIYEISLAKILVTANTSTLAAENLTDERLDTTVCGTVEGAVSQVDTSTFFSQFNAWYATKTAEYAAQWQAWFDSIEAGTYLTQNSADSRYIQIDNFGNYTNDITKELADQRIFNEEVANDLTLNSKISPNTNKFYDYKDSTHLYTCGTVDHAKVYAETITTGGNTIAITTLLKNKTGVTPSNLADCFAVGEQVTLQDDAGKENLIISNINDTTDTLTFTTNISGTYAAGANIYRSNLSTTWGFGGFNSQVVDPYLKSLLHFNGADASTTFTDEKGLTWTAAGNAQIDTAQSKLGGASGLFDGTGDYIETPDNDVFTLGTNDFTIEFFFKRTTTGVQEFFFGQGDSTGSNASTSIRIYTASDTVRAWLHYGANTKTLISTTTVANTNWHHVAVVRNGNTATLYLDGTSEATVDVTGVTVNDSTNKVAIGRMGEYASSYFNGWIDEFRFVNGEAKYTSNFTPPTAEFTINATGEVSLTDVDVRMNVEPFEAVDSIATYAYVTDIVGVGVDTSISIVDTSANESYTTLTTVSTDFGSTLEFAAGGSVATAEEKVTLKLELSKTNTSDNVIISKIIGGVA